MSARAAWRLEELGVPDVKLYVAGKKDWLANGLPGEGKLDAFPTAGQAANRDVPTCRPSESLAAVRARVRAAGWTSCVVVNERNVVFGILRRKTIEGDDDGPVEAAMDLGPVTFRPDELLSELALHLVQGGAATCLITTADGQLIGHLTREEALKRTGGGAGA